ncbi:MAG: DUF1659 domain-containing protein [Firmicutes bacterium]|jgi:hypothetical protein|nr:DUF1659 domain-containing protein [Bacillota bacterium]
MAINAETISSRLQLRLITGFDGEGRPIRRSRSYSGVKPEAGNEDVYDVGSALADLQKNQLDAIRRIDEVELTEE